MQTRARKLGYRIRRNADGSYTLMSEGTSVLRCVTPPEINNFLRGATARSSSPEPMEREQNGS
jgi:hypothetical protein